MSVSRFIVGIAPRMCGDRARRQPECSAVSLVPRRTVELSLKPGPAIHVIVLQGLQSGREFGELLREARLEHEAMVLCRSRTISAPDGLLNRNPTKILQHAENDRCFHMLHALVRQEYIVDEVGEARQIPRHHLEVIVHLTGQ